MEVLILCSGFLLELSRCIQGIQFSIIHMNRVCFYTHYNSHSHILDTYFLTIAGGLLLGYKIMLEGHGQTTIVSGGLSCLYFMDIFIY